MSSARHSDVLILGAGPAGCAAAYDLAAAGLSVRLLDKHEFPRPKPCAGGLTMRTVSALRYSITPVIERVADDWMLGLGMHEATRMGAWPAKPMPIVAMTVRSRLDAYCLEQTKAAAGVTFERNGKVRELAPLGSEGGANEGWSLRTEDAHYTARYFIGADGANGVSAKLLGRAAGHHARDSFAAAVEAEVPIDDPLRFAMEMRLDYVPRGYAWIFPKGDHLNVGIYARGSVKGLKASLVEFVRARLDQTLETRDIVGWRVPVSGQDRAPRTDGAFLVGDAGGLAEPMFGEGIFYAIASGQAAAQTIVEVEAGRSAAAMASRFARLRAPIDRDLRAWTTFAEILDRNPARVHWALSLGSVRWGVMKSTMIGWTLTETLWRLLLLPVARMPRATRARLPALERGP